jgi:hypothetical protein
MFYPNHPIRVITMQPMKVAADPASDRINQTLNVSKLMPVVDHACVFDESRGCVRWERHGAACSV